MADNNEISTVTSAADNATDQDYTPVTGTDVGTKRNLDIYTQGSILASTHALVALILGTLPDPNYDQIQRTVGVGGAEKFTFVYRGFPRFEVNITDPNENYDISITDLALMVLEDGTAMILNEDGSAWSQE